MSKTRAPRPSPARIAPRWARSSSRLAATCLTSVIPSSPTGPGTRPSWLPADSVARPSSAPSSWWTTVSRTSRPWMAAAWPGRRRWRGRRVCCPWAGPPPCSGGTALRRTARSPSSASLLVTACAAPGAPRLSWTRAPRPWASVKDRRRPRRVPRRCTASSWRPLPRHASRWTSAASLCLSSTSLPSRGRWRGTCPLRGGSGCARRALRSSGQLT
mmetsp:Transcript_98322/g.273477  ORF Transcript_98322/g.273477 Transcript_98322/m.273477 type:complete len:215 (-) Transcript_98322:237-881(-)